MSVEVTVSTTPNEHALKFTLNRKSIEEGYKTYNNPEDAEENPVARAVFAHDGVASVFLMADFVTVTKKTEADWAALQGPVLEAIRNSY